MNGKKERMKTASMREWWMRARSVALQLGIWQRHDMHELSQWAMCEWKFSYRLCCKIDDNCGAITLLYSVRLISCNSTICICRMHQHLPHAMPHASEQMIQNRISMEPIRGCMFNLIITRLMKWHFPFALPGTDSEIQNAEGSNAVCRLLPIPLPFEKILRCKSSGLSMKWLQGNQ